MPVRLRDIRPEDKPALVAFHALLSDETRYRRYHATKGDLTKGDLRYLTEVDGRSHVALVAFDGDRPWELLGVARAIADGARPGEGELAIVVRDDQQGTGLGAILVDGLLHRVAAEGFEQVRAEVQADNHRAMRFFQGFGARQRAGAGAVRELIIPARGPDEPQDL
jgi:ribosomal protein S18 acetylase RimI-like enzyme